jgi:hypothetical protein
LITQGNFLDTNLEKPYRLYEPETFRAANADAFGGLARGLPYFWALPHTNKWALPYTNKKENTSPMSPTKESGKGTSVQEAEEIAGTMTGSPRAGEAMEPSQRSTGADGVKMGSGGAMSSAAPSARAKSVMSRAGTGGPGAAAAPAVAPKPGRETGAPRIFIRSMPGAMAPSRAATGLAPKAGVRPGAGPRAHVLAPPGTEIAERVGPVSAIDYPNAILRASTAHFNVYYDPSLGANGPVIADGVLATCESEYNAVQGWFSGITPPNLPFNVYLAAGIGGAYHYGCNGTDLYCDGDTSPNPNIDHSRMLVVAEEVEVFSAAQGAGWNCGASNGEGLSRVLATELYPAQLNGFTSAASWLDTSNRPNWVDNNDNTDTNYTSIGCSVLFLNFLHDQLRFSYNEIVAAAAPTLEQTYTKLTGATDGFAQFTALLQQHFPIGQPSGVVNDDPFPLENPLAAWRSWEWLGGVLTSPPQAVAWGPNRLDIFAEGSDSALWHRWWDGAQWGGWESLGGVLTSPPNVVSWGPNRLDIFVLGTDSALWHRWWDGANWGGWESRGGVLTSPPVSVSWGENRLDIFGLGEDHALWHTYWNGHAWGGWESLGGVLMSPPSAVSWGPNRLDIFGLGEDHALWHISWNGANWSNWESLGGVLTSPASVVAWDENRLDIFANGQDHALWHLYWNGANWSNWESLGGILVAPPNAIAPAPNRLDIFGIGTDNAAYVQRWNGSSWSGWRYLGGSLFSPISPTAWSADRRDIFTIGGDSALWHSYYA